MTYGQYAPTSVDLKGLCLEDQQDWLVVAGRNRDSKCLERSNFEVLLEDLGGESALVEIHRFGHWACGWFELLLAHPIFHDKLCEWKEALELYHVADDEHYCRMEMEEANEVWERCYDWKERIGYIRKNENQFEFRNFEDLMGCVRGDFFCGYASELLA